MKGCRHAVFYALLMPRHAVLFANGAPAESFYPGAAALPQLRRADLRWLCARFPGVMEDPVAAYGLPARGLLSNRDARAQVRSFQGGELTVS